MTRSEPCPICEHGSWCLVKRDRTAAICARVESRQKVQRPGKDAAGWMHQLVEDRPFVPMRTIRPAKQLPAKDFAKIAASCAEALRPEALASHARALGVSVESLRRLGVGIEANIGFTYPMSDATGRVVGIRLRAPNGRKWAVTGSSNGLFLPSGLETTVDTLVICEGASDTAAMLDWGFAAAGRPSCTGGVAMLLALVRRLRPRTVVIASDVDEHGAGQRGADALAQELLTVAPVVRVIEPTGYKDFRAWKQAGASRADVLDLIGEATARQLAVTFRLECPA